MIYGGFRSNYYVYRLSNNTSAINDIYRYCIDKDISVDDLYKDISATKNKYNGFFWFKKEPHEINIIEDKDELVFDFSKANFSTLGVYVITNKILDYPLIYNNGKFNLYYINNILNNLSNEEKGCI